MNREQRRHWRRYVFGHPDLTLGERLVLLALETFADFPDGTNARPGVAVMAEMCGFRTRVVELALARGRQLRLIEQTARANPKLGLAATYRLVPLPISTRTTVQVETDFNPHETRFNPHEDDISTRTTVQPTNKDDQSNTPKGGARAKGTYLPDDWFPAPDVVAQMRAEQPHINQELELEKFRDHWRSTTRNAMKRDWTAAYRNWIRNAAKWAPRNGTPPDGPTAYERKKARNYAVYQSLADDEPTPIPAIKELDP
jgi:hypothetical protein